MVLSANCVTFGLITMWRLVSMFNKLKILILELQYICLSKPMCAKDKKLSSLSGALSVHFSSTTLIMLCNIYFVVTKNAKKKCVPCVEPKNLIMTHSNLILCKYLHQKFLVYYRNNVIGNTKKECLRWVKGNKNKC